MPETPRVVVDSAVAGAAGISGCDLVVVVATPERRRGSRAAGLDAAVDAVASAAPGALVLARPPWADGEAAPLAALGVLLGCDVVWLPSGLVEQVLRVQAGDRLTIVKGTVPGSFAMPADSSKRNLIAASWYVATVREPYFMVVDSSEALGTFFEDGEPDIGDRIWPHFIDFDILETRTASRIGALGRFAEAFRQSANWGNGALAPITRALADDLHDELRAGEG